MTVKTIVLHRYKDNKVHKTVLRKSVRLHIDIIDILLERAYKWGMTLDIDEIMGQVVERY